MYPGQS
ncbi:unnamed protein product [Callosobruchus maculatus]|nr:unnamed protein product [Callosobruchus maculatus]